MNTETGGGLTGRELDVILEAAHPSRPDRETLTRNHVERILAARVAAARADGRESLAGEILALADEFADEKDHAARWARETNNSFHEAMSRKVAWESAETRLRALVAPTGHDGETGDTE